MVVVLLTSSPAKHTVKTIIKFNKLYVIIIYQTDDKNLLVLPRETMGDSNDRGWFLGINHGHVTYFSL